MNAPSDADLLDGLQDEDQPAQIRRVTLRLISDRRMFETHREVTAAHIARVDAALLSMSPVIEQIRRSQVEKQVLEAMHVKMTERRNAWLAVAGLIAPFVLAALTALGSYVGTTRAHHDNATQHP